MSATTVAAGSTADETNDGDAAETSAPSGRSVLAACSLTLLRLLSHASLCHSRTHCETDDSGDNRGGRVDDINTNSRSSCAGAGNAADARTLVDGIVTDDSTTTGWDKVEKTNPTADGHTISDAIITIAGSCLSRVAREIDFAAGPRGAMEGVLSLLLPSTSLIVREQAALTLAEIAGQGYEVALGSQVANKAEARRDDNIVGRVGGLVMSGIGSGGREELRLILWRHFCAGVVAGRGSQVGTTNLDVMMREKENVKHQIDWSGVRSTVEYNELYTYTTKICTDRGRERQPRKRLGDGHLTC